jgi:beta-lactamase superfamily II metal-dependent hydrolase
MRKLAVLLIVVGLILSSAGCARESPTASVGLTLTPTSSLATTPPHTATPVPTQGELKVNFIDVGQGDSILIDLGETEVLIDGGEKSPGVVNYLKKYVDGPLEVMVATHPHSDHIGGLIAVLGAFQVQQTGITAIRVTPRHTMNSWQQSRRRAQMFMWENEGAKSLLDG